MREDSLVWQLLNSARHGTLDTSLVATDGNNNPNTMNSVFGVLDRIVASLKANSAVEEVSKETVAYLGTLDGLVIDKDVVARLDPGDVELLTKREFLEIENGVVTLRLNPGEMRRTPHILAVGEDSIGTLGALCRVYLNIGEYHQQWVRTHNLMLASMLRRLFESRRRAKTQPTGTPPKRGREISPSSSSSRVRPNGWKMPTGWSRSWTPKTRAGWSVTPGRGNQCWTWNKRHTARRCSRENASFVIPVNNRLNLPRPFGVNQRISDVGSIMMNTSRRRSKWLSSLISVETTIFQPTSVIRCR